MEFQVEKTDRYTKVKPLIEKMDSTVSPDVKAEFVFHNGKGERNLVLDLEQVKYVDSSGLSAILVANRLCNSCQGSLVLTNIQESVMKLITISQLDTILNIVPNPLEIDDFLIMQSIERDLNAEE